jgi:hypothetical protein
MTALKAITALRNKATTPTPRLALQRAVAGLADNYSASALAFLAWQMTPIGGGELDTETLARVVARAAEMDDAHRRRFAEEILFNLSSIADYRYLAPLVVQWVPVEKLVDGLMQALGGDNLFHALNALALPYYVFGLEPGYQPTPAQAQRLLQLADAFSELPNSPLPLRDAARHFVLPKPL